MNNKIIEKYKKLNEACKKYPRIQLMNRIRPREDEKDCASDGFIEVFCLTDNEVSKIKKYMNK